MINGRFVLLMVLVMSFFSVVHAAADVDCTTEKFSTASEDYIISNLENIEDLGKCSNTKKIEAAIEKKYSLLLSGLKGRPKIGIENGVLSSKIESSEMRSSVESLDLRGKKDWQIAIEENGEITILQPREIKADSLSLADSFKITSEGMNVFRFVAHDGTVLSGDTMLFDSGYVIFAHGNERQVSIRSSEEELNIGAVRGARVDVYVMPGNKMFGLLKKKYSGDGSYTLVPDENAELFFSVGDGDMLFASSRKDATGQSMTPLIEYSPADGGRTQIRNGRYVIELAKGSQREVQILLDPKKNLYVNSAAFRLKTSLSPDIIMSSSNRYSVVDVGGNEVMGTDKGLEVSEKLEPNMMKTAEDLEMKFKIKVNQGKEEGPISSSLIQTIDQWLRSREGVQRYVEKLNLYSNYDNANAGDLMIAADAKTTNGDRSMSLGDKFIDKFIQGETKVRDQLSVLEVLDHELFHILRKRVSLNEKRAGVSEDSLESLYQGRLIKIEETIRATPAYKKLISDIHRVSRGSMFGMAVEGEDIDNSNLAKLWGIAGFSSTEPGEKEIVERVGQMIYEHIKTYGLYSYSFTRFEKDQFSEITTTYHELDIDRPELLTMARMNPDFAQLELDMVFSLNPRPPDWLRTDALRRCKAIVGHVCTPCTLYKATCVPT